MICKILFFLFFATLALLSSSRAQGVEKSIFVERVSDVVTPVLTLYKDRNGFLWVGRWDGLYRYDGTNFKSFTHIAKTWSNFAVSSIQEDHDGNLWIGAAVHNLLIYNPSKDTTQIIQEIYPEVIIPNLYSEITVHDSIAFIASSEAIFIIYHKAHKIKTIKIREPYQQHIKAIKADHHGNLWVALETGLLKIRPDFTKQYYPEITQSRDELSGIVVDRDGSIWIRTTADLIHFDQLTSARKHFPFLKKDDNRFWEGNSAIEQDGKGSIWLGAPSRGGLVRFNPVTEKFDIFPHKADDPNSVSSNYIKKLVYTKDDDILWIGTETGLDKIVFNKQNFNVKAMDFSSQQNYFIESLYQDSDLNLWVRTNDSKIHLLAHEPNNHISYKTYLKKVISMNPEDFLEEDGNGNLLFVAHWGLSSFNKKTGRTKQAYDGFVPNSVWPIKIVENSKMLARVDGRALIITTGDTLRVVMDILFKENEDNVRMMVDQYNNILASRGDGVFMLDLANEEFVSVYNRKDGDPNDIHVYLKDPEGIIWMGTGGSGLLSYDQQTGKLRNYGFADHTIGGMLMDDNHNLWASTNKGLLMVNRESGTVTTYTSHDGIRLDQIRNYACIKGRDGNFYFGGLNKILYFDPLKIKAHDFVPKVFITKIKVLNRYISEINDQYKVVELISDIEMNYNKNTLSFEFASLNYAYPDKTIYHYQMTGVDRDWILSETQQITYSNLAPGTYFFRIKASNSHSVANPKIKEIKITILAPLWATWWAYSLYVILFGALAYVLWKRWITRVQLKTLATIKSAEAEKLREVDILKSNFFANISHEFRTPLTLLLGPLEKRSAMASDPGDKKELNMMHRNASRLLTLVNQLLDLSRLEAGTLSLKCRYFELHPTILSIMSQFSSMADSKAINFEVSTPQKPVALFFDPDKLEKIITNLLSNAFKFTPVGGSIILTITQQSPDENFKNGYAEIIIADTGTGIEPEHLSKIFDRFYQVDMSSTRAYEGSGIGLSLTKELVELHHGTISVTSTAGKGSTFTVKLPLGDSHLKREEVESADVEITIPKSNGVDHIDQPEDNNIENTILGLPRLLLVEDNADLRYYLRENLKQQFSLSEAEDGEKGIATALTEIPDLIISDLMMPKINGLQLCQQLKEDEKTSHIPIILLTAKADIETKLQGYKHGADDYIAKPFQIEEVIVRIENLIANRKRIQEKFARHLSLTPGAVPVTSIDERFLKRAMEVVEKFIADSSFGVEPFAQEIGVSHTQLYRKLHAITGFNPNEFIRHMRLLRAADLMRQKAGNVADITYQVGFNNLSYFSKVFKEKFGVTPIEFLKNPLDKMEK